MKKFFQVVDIDSIFNIWLWSCLFVFLYRFVWYVICEKICLRMSVCLSVFPSVCL